MTTEQRIDEWRYYDGSSTVPMNHGFDLYLRPGCEYSRKRYVYQTAEQLELGYLANLDMRGFVCMDVGANIGYLSRFLIDGAHAGEVHSFEPDDFTFEIL
jgi:hypothetical protein